MVHKKICVLVVEDDPRVLRLEQMVLEKEGYSVVSVESGEEALEVLAEISPSLMILDVGLPGIDGFIACQRIREFSPVPIIMVTGKDFNEDKVRGLESGADDYITKPFSPNELAARVKAALRRSSMTGEVVSPTI
jgi:DNA-binding response OmpR family regulator